MNTWRKDTPSRQRRTSAEEHAALVKDRLERTGMRWAYGWRQAMLHLRLHQRRLARLCGTPYSGENKLPYMDKPHKSALTVCAQTNT